MGFYSASQLVQDARRHGVRVLPIDVNPATGIARWKARRSGCSPGPSPACGPLPCPSLRCAWGCG